MKKSLLILAAALLGIGVATAQTGKTRSYGQLALNHTPEQYDSLVASFRSRVVVESYQNFVNEFIDVDPARVDMSGALPDAVYAERLKMMATQVQLPFNDVVKALIVKYTKKGGIMERVLGSAQYYFPIFEEMLYRYNLPMELKMLPVIESALTPRALSSAKAMGLWQFMMNTGKYYGLEINSFVDERCDTYKATEAACKYLRDMYRIYGDWTLVIASYNCGAGNVNKALARAGEGAKTYWDIYPYLPTETRGYVPAFIAASYAYTYYKAHDLNPRPVWHPVATDTIQVNRLMHLDQIATTINLPLEVLRGLNPQYSIDVIPAKGRTYVLTLPQDYLSAYIQNYDAICAKDSVYLAQYLNISNFSDEQLAAGVNTPKNGTKTTYTVKSGDVLGKIAGKYNVSVKKLMEWNNIKDATKIQIGQKLVIYN